MQIVSVIGSKDSGKTTAIEYLVRQLSNRGLVVGSAKHMHSADSSVDQPRKDTGRHASAGAKVIVAVAPRELTVIKKVDTSDFTLDALLKLLENEELDVIVLEGFHRKVSERHDILKIVTAKDETDALRTLEGTSPPILAITGTISSLRHLSEIKGIPVVDLEETGNLLVDRVEVLVRTRGHDERASTANHIFHS